MTNYVIFGAGRVGANMAGYLNHLGHRAVLVTHQSALDNPDECAGLIRRAEIVAAAIPDDGIDAWLKHWRATIDGQTVIHFSGAVSIGGMYAFHPLYSFPKTQAPLDKIKNIAFACPANGPAFSSVFPNAPNPHFIIADKDRAHYHALAVLGGNLAAFLWNEIAKGMTAYAGPAPEKVMGGYLESIVERFLETPTNSLTGPVARKDAKTVAANLDALSEAPKLMALYEAFLKTAWPQYYEEGGE